MIGGTSRRLGIGDNSTWGDMHLMLPAGRSNIKRLAHISLRFSGPFSTGSSQRHAVVAGSRGTSKSSTASCHANSYDPVAEARAVSRRTLNPEKNQVAIDNSCPAFVQFLRRQELWVVSNKIGGKIRREAEPIVSAGHVHLYPWPRSPGKLAEW